MTNGSDLESESKSAPLRTSCVRACARARVWISVLAPPTRSLLRDVSGRMSPTVSSCRNGSAETGASVWALLWQNQQKQPESNSVPRQTHWHCHPDPRSLPEPEGKTNYRLQLWACACFPAIYFHSLNRLPTPGTVKPLLETQLVLPLGGKLIKKKKKLK